MGVASGVEVSGGGAGGVEVDTIVARATGLGPSAIAVLRLSGPRAASILEEVTGERAPPAREASLRRVRDADGALLDEGLVTVFRAPASYTGEDVVEFSGHGGQRVPATVLAAFEAAGARPAEPGEFTRRAWANGKLDLLQAEAVDDLISSRSAAAQRAALSQLDRGLSRRVAEARESLVRVDALLIHHLDFPEEDDAPTPVTRIADVADELARDLRALAGTAAEGELLRSGATVVLAGPPNAGKSSLLNALVGRDRAIVTELPGTTRDAIEVEVSLGGFPFRLVDTAGLREPSEAVERIGIEVAERELAQAHAVLACVPPESRVEEVVGEIVTRTSAPVIVAFTQGDREGARPAGAGGEGGAGAEVVESVAPEAGDGGAAGDPARGVPGTLEVVARLRVSALDGTGLEELRMLLPRIVFSGLIGASEELPVLTRERHRLGVEGAATELEEFAGAVRAGVPPEVASAHLKSAASALEGLVGVIESEEVLDLLFSSFCIGK